MTERERDDALVDFLHAVGRRVDAGAVAYGDRSFSRPPAELIREIREEVQDVAGWAFILDCRLAALEKAAEGLSRPTLVAVKEPA